MKKRIIALLLVMILLPLKVKALTGNTSLECDKSTAIKGEIINCTLKGTIEEDEIKMYEGTIQIEDNYFELVSVTPNSIVETGEINNAHMEYIINNTVTGQFDLATIVVKIKDNISDTVSAQTNILIADQKMTGTTDTQGKSISTTSSRVKINSTNNKLSGITLSSGTISPEFSEDTTSYTAVVDDATVTVSATAASTASRIEGVGEKQLDYGTNTVQITVIPEQGTLKTYTLSITRQDDRNSECNINNIDFYNYDINFNKNNTNYTINVEDAVDSIQVGDDEMCPNDFSICIKRDSIQLDNNAIISEISLNGETITEISDAEHGYTIGELNQGENVLNITIKAENNDTKTYKFTIYRGQKDDDSASSSLESTTGNKGDVTNPKTGSSFIIFTMILLVTSFSIVYYYYRKSDKERKENAEE